MVDLNRQMPVNHYFAVKQNKRMNGKEERLQKTTKQNENEVKFRFVLFFVLFSECVWRPRLRLIKCVTIKFEWMNE